MEPKNEGLKNQGREIRTIDSQDWLRRFSLKNPGKVIDFETEIQVQAGQERKGAIATAVSTLMGILSNNN